MNDVTRAMFANAEAFSLQARSNRKLADRERNAGRYRYAQRLEQIADAYAERARQIRDQAWRAAR